MCDLGGHSICRIQIQNFGFIVHTETGFTVKLDPDSLIEYPWFRGHRDLVEELGHRDLVDGGRRHTLLFDMLSIEHSMGGPGATDQHSQLILSASKTTTQDDSRDEWTYTVEPTTKNPTGPTTPNNRRVLYRPGDRFNADSN